MTEQKVLYFDAFSGLSGDMILSSLISLFNKDKAWLEHELKKLGLKGYKISIKKSSLMSIEGVSFKVIETEKQKKHRRLSDIKDLLYKSKLEKSIIENSLSIFNILAIAEGKIHGQPKEEIHFHEVGGIDSIIDIVGSCLLLAHAKANILYCSPLPLGRGFVSCEHGLIPLPAPATMEILKDHPVYGAEEEGEYVTPTGAAIVKALFKAITYYPTMNINAIGYGIGSAVRKRPNILRVVLGTRNTTSKEDKKLLLVETNIDDINPEIIPYVSEKLIKEGAKDVFTTPITMKKGRNGIKLSVLTTNHLYDRIVSIIFTETTSIGVRKISIERDELERRKLTISNHLGEVKLKESLFKGKVVQVKPEFESLQKLAKKHKIPLKLLYNDVMNLYYRKQ